MFEDLDDPTPPFVGLTTRDAVAAKVAHRRAVRRTRQRMALAVSLGVIAVAVLTTTVLTVHRSGDRTPSIGQTTVGSTPSSTPTSAGPTPTTASSTTTTEAPAPPLVDVLDFDFTTTSDGWALGSTCAEDKCLTVLRTKDGGRTWSALPTAPPAEGAPTRISVGGDGTIYAFGAGALIVSSDGGETWRVTLGTDRVSDVLDVEPEGPDVWALTLGPCAKPCGGALWKSTDAGQTWKQAFLPGPDFEPGADAELIRQGGGQAWLVQSGETASAAFSLWHTDDDGATWAPLTYPCDDAHGLGAHLAVVDPDNLWLACKGDDATVQEGKQIFRSTDGGKTWKAAADPGLTGHLAGIAAADADHAFLALERNTLLSTTDRGASWHEAIPVAEGNPTDHGITPVRFIDPQHGWALGQVAQDVPALWRTEDGGATWKAVPLG
jgi:photosystem II stability/assembly factor-like uncharacterized protein